MKCTVTKAFNKSGQGGRHEPGESVDLMQHQFDRLYKLGCVILEGEAELIEEAERQAAQAMAAAVAKGEAARAKVLEAAAAKREALKAAAFSEEDADALTTERPEQPPAGAPFEAAPAPEPARPTRRRRKPRSS